MEKKIFRKKLLILLMIISIVATDFFILGSNLLTYSSDIGDETNNPNVEFSAYFKNDANERVDSIEKSIKDENLKLYAEIAVKNEGYLNEGTAIELEDSNFKLKSNITSNYIKEINGNKVILKTITAGETIEIELDIEPIISDVLTHDMLSQISIVKLNGSYTGAKESGIQYGKEVRISFKPDETANAELEIKIITNAVLGVNGTNKRVVQLLIKSRLTDNQYPVEQTTFNLDIPHLGEGTPEVSAIALSELATNGKTEISDSEYTINENKLQITLKNEKDTTGAIKWCKNAYDELVVTYIYEENVDLTSNAINVNSEIKLYEIENILSSTMSTSIENEGLNQTIIGRTEITTEEIYKGQLYANTVAEEKVNIEYETKTILAITKENIVDKIIINEGNDIFVTENGELEANTKYLTTEINLEKVLDILGQEGSIEVKSGEITTTINKDTTVDTNGNVVINHQNPTAELVFTTTAPVKAGALEINHKKIIGENSYTRTQLQSVKELKIKGTIISYLEEEILESNSTETDKSSIELKETITKAELTIENSILSATAENEVVVGIKLLTEDIRYDLFKNPKIILKLPEVVENVEVLENPIKLYDDTNELEISNPQYDSTNKGVILSLEGEQTKYLNSSVYIQLKLKITIDEFATSTISKIIMGYNNENASIYDGDRVDYGVVEKEIEISSPSQLIKKFNLNTNENITLDENILQKIKGNQTLNFEIGLINNKGTEINNVKILGKLPTIGNIIINENTLETTLKEITAERGEIYYTENVNATVDINNQDNGWTEEVLPNAKMFLIKIDSLNNGETCDAKLVVQTTDLIQESVISYAQYEVSYDTVVETNIIEKSRQIRINFF